jgi:hypothetical protein
MKLRILVAALISVLLVPSASANTECKNANKEYQELILFTKKGPGLREKNVFLKNCKPSKSKSMVTCAQAWEIEVFKQQQNSALIAQRIVLNNKKCFSPTLVEKAQTSK